MIDYQQLIYSEGCSSLTSVVIPNNVTSIGSHAFQGCSGLTSVIIGDGAKVIKSRAFEDCNNMKSLAIGKSVTSIEDQAFSQCKVLEDVFCYAESVPKLKFRVFNGVDLENVTLHVPVASVEIYKQSWNQFKEVVPLTGQETSVGSIKMDDQTSEWYQLDGRKSFGPKRGLNIIRMKDGTTKKILF